MWRLEFYRFLHWIISEVGQVFILVAITYHVVYQNEIGIKL